ncbi:MAG: hypothetical protein KAR07_13075, partial [Spirochaetes bacterium]|nr:hypothetical protein [Spirochaetota bacterium]
RQPLEGRGIDGYISCNYWEFIKLFITKGIIRISYIILFFEKMHCLSKRMLHNPENKVLYEIRTVAEPGFLKNTLFEQKNTNY